MLALSGLALATTLCCAPPARAGHWVFSVGGKDGNGNPTSTFTPTVKGNTSPTPPTWTVPPDSNNSLTVTFPNVIASDKETVSNPSCTCNVKATLTILATWTHDTGQDDISDPAPTKVWLIEKSTASWQGATNGAQPPGDDDGGPPPASPFTCSGDASDGVPGDQQYYQALPVGGPVTSGSVTTPTTQAAPPPGWSTQAVNQDKFTLTRNLSADGTATFAAPCSVSMTCSLGSYSVSIHAQPYNFRSVGDPIDSGTGTVVFNYAWSSTSGNLANIDGSACVVYEVVTYPGTPGTFQQPEVNPSVRTTG